MYDIAKYMYTAHMYKARTTIIAARKRNHMLHSCTLTNFACDRCVFPRGSKANQSVKSCALALATYRAQVQYYHNAVWCKRLPDHLTCATVHPRGTPPPRGGQGGDDRVDCLMDMFSLVMSLLSCIMLATHSLVMSALSATMFAMSCVLVLAACVHCNHVVRRGCATPR